ncbi:MAG: type II toxin-antitoxin system VapC family toxin [Rhodocyclaceae bacterium]|nr:type II toxin-antitoxin system VapC family toxin [Rhodocyclaceae bacterium]
MNLLLDTHTFLWWLTDSPKLSTKAREAIADANNEAWVSAVTGWECATKHRLGKLPEAERFIARAEEIIQRAGMRRLPIDLFHGLRAGSYLDPHGDPFDRMLAAQAEIEGLILVTRDPVFSRFPVQALW